MQKRLLFIIVFMVSPQGTLTAASSIPDVLFNQMNMPIVNAWYSDSTLMYPQSIGDSFQSTETWSITSFIWRGVYEDSATDVADDFKVAMWAVTGALPSSQISNLPGSLTRTATGTITSWGWNLYEYTLRLNQPLLLNPGTHVLEIQNQTPASPKNWAWTTSAGDRFLYHDDAGVWFPGDVGSLQFQVMGTVVPEPASGLLACVGMCWICVGRRIRMD